MEVFFIMIFNIRDFTNYIKSVEYRTKPVNLELINYITLQSGFSANGESFIRRVGDTIEAYLVINGTFTGGTRSIFTFNESIIPYSGSNTRRFPLIIPASGYTTNATIDINTGVVTAVLPASMTATSVVFNAVYTVK